MSEVSVFDNILGWMKKLLSKIDFDAWLRKIGITSPEIIKSIKYSFIAFFAGFLFKKYFRFILMCSVIIIVLSVLLHAKDILSINWDSVKSILSFDPTKTTVENLVVNFFHWVKNNLIVFIVLSLSFLLGYKLG